MKVRFRHKISPDEVRRILIRSTNWVGDTVMMLPSLVAVRETFPCAEITVLANPWVLPLLVNHPAVDRTIVIDKGGGVIHAAKEVLLIISRLRNVRFDLAVLFQNAFEAALLSYLGGVHYRVGYNSDGRGLLLTHTVIRDKAIRSVHQVDYFLGLAHAMGWQVTETNPVVYLNEEDSRAVSMMLSSEGICDNEMLVGLNPGAAYGPAKRWPAERFAIIGDWASKRWGAEVVLFGSPAEAAVAEEVAMRMNAQSLNVCGKTTLGQAMSLIKRCDFFLTNDSGLMHVAAALNRPLVALFGPTDHVKTRPVSRNARMVRHDIECSPCLKQVCPLDHRCMLSIEPHEVWREMEDLRNEVQR
jgi:heptosyltransferase-2